MRRPSSPDGGSTLMTSAPVSASSRAHRCARCVLKSSTRSPASAPVEEATILLFRFGGPVQVLGCKCGQIEGRVDLLQHLAMRAGARATANADGFEGLGINPS